MKPFFHFFPCLTLPALPVTAVSEEIQIKRGGGERLFIISYWKKKLTSILSF